MTTKQSVQQSKTQSYSVADEQLNDDLILRCWKGVEEQCKRVSEFNLGQGLTNVDRFIGYVYGSGPKPMDVQQKLRFLQKTRHKRSGAWITTDTLLSSGTISDIELQVFENKTFPYATTSQMRRVQTMDGNTYLVRSMRLIGLDELGSIVSCPLSDVDFTRKIPLIQTTAQLPNGSTVKALAVGSGEASYPTSQKIYLTPFTKENVLATLSKYQPGEDSNYKVGYMYEKEGVTNQVGISSLEEFLTDNFNSVWDAKTAPTPTISLDSRDLLNYAKHDRESKDKTHYQ